MFRRISWIATRSKRETIWAMHATACQSRLGESFGPACHFWVRPAKARRFHVATSRFCSRRAGIVLATQLTAQLPDGPVAWCFTDPPGTRHRGHGTLNTRLDLLTTAVDELIDELYTALHRAADSPR